MKITYTLTASSGKLLIAALLGVVMVACAACSVKNVAGPDTAVAVTLDGGTEHEVVALFGRVVAGAPGVSRARMVSSKQVPDSPQASRAVWNVSVTGDDTFALQNAIMDTIESILDSGGVFELQGKQYSYAPAELALLKGIRPGSATAAALQFIVDRERMRDQEFFGR